MGLLKRFVILGIIAFIVGSIPSVFASTDRFQPKNLQLQTIIELNMHCPLAIVTEGNGSQYNGTFCTLSESSIIPGLDNPCLFHPEPTKENASWTLIDPSLCYGLLQAGS